MLDREKHSVTVGKEPVELTYKEYELLKLLMTNAGIVTTRELILDRVWESILRRIPDVGHAYQDAAAETEGRGQSDQDRA